MMSAFALTNQYPGFVTPAANAPATAVPSSISNQPTLYHTDEWIAGRKEGIDLNPSSMFLAGADRYQSGVLVIRLDTRLAIRHSQREDPGYSIRPRSLHPRDARLKPSAAKPLDFLSPRAALLSARTPLFFGTKSAARVC